MSDSQYSGSSLIGVFFPLSQQAQGGQAGAGAGASQGARAPVVCCRPVCGFFPSAPLLPRGCSRHSGPGERWGTGEGNIPASCSGEFLEAAVSVLRGHARSLFPTVCHLQGELMGL